VFHVRGNNKFKTACRQRTLPAGHMITDAIPKGKDALG